MKNDHKFPKVNYPSGFFDNNWLSSRMCPFYLMPTVYLFYNSKIVQEHMNPQMPNVTGQAMMTMS